MEEIINEIKVLCDKMEKENIPFFIYTPFLNRVNVTTDEKYLNTGTMEQLVDFSRIMYEEAMLKIKEVKI